MASVADLGIGTGSGSGIHVDAPEGRDHVDRPGDIPGGRGGRVGEPPARTDLGVRGAAGTGEKRNGGAAHVD